MICYQIVFWLSPELPEHLSHASNSKGLLDVEHDVKARIIGEAGLEAGLQIKAKKIRKSQKKTKNVEQKKSVS